ncbi:MAG TPA: mechanosensitive ion channel domain-containing protein [Dyella sp.]|uniref:mechanosensitive ion channel family protein n=1 Tax=Dyella sp. TaxID=1869338 RepID=UPI002F929B70
MAADFLAFWNTHPWGRLGLSVAVALIVAFVLRSLAFVFLHRLARRRPFAADLLGHANPPMEWLIPLLMLGIGLRVTPDIDRFAWLGNLNLLLLILLIAVLTWLAVRCIGAVQLASIRLYPVDREDNLRARQVVTQVRVLGRIAAGMVVLIGLAAILMTIPAVRQFGAGLLASAGVAGIAIGFAAKPVLSNLIAGVQIALTQPIRLDDVVIIQNEWGRIEEIGGTYVIVRIWDERRLVVPLNYFIENPFENWTRVTARLTGTVFLWVDYRLPLEPLRAELRRLCDEAPEWDRRVCVLQLVDATDRAVQLRALVSAADSGRAWDLRCRVREGLVAYVQRHYPDCLPRQRASVCDLRSLGTTSSGAPSDA